MAMAGIERIARGNFRLLERLFPQITRVPVRRRPNIHGTPWAISCSSMRAGADNLNQGNYLPYGKYLPYAGCSPYG
jgi:hypothetical protein